MSRGIRFCSTFLHVVRVRKHTDMRELHAKRVQKRATKSDPSGHCLLGDLNLGQIFKIKLWMVKADTLA